MLTVGMVDLRGSPSKQINEMLEMGKYRMLSTFTLRYFVVLLMLPFTASGSPEPFNRHYDHLIKTYWHPGIRINGISTTAFDYKRMAGDAIKPDSLYQKTVEALERVEPNTLTPLEQKAFWINAYNFAAMQLIVNHYPVDSIRSLKISLRKYPWSKKVVRVAGTGYSLKQIEKDILLKKFKDPRIIFAVGCAAVSCPDRPNFAFHAQQLDHQLDNMIYHFFQNPDKGLSIDKSQGVVSISWILKKDAALFRNHNKGVLGFVMSYLPREEQRWLSTRKVRIRYLTHDWTVNDTAQKN